MFDRSEFTVEVIEEQPFNGTLRLPLIVTANDLDDEVVNGAISYSISDGKFILLFTITVQLCLQNLSILYNNLFIVSHR